MKETPKKNEHRIIFQFSIAKTIQLILKKKCFKQKNLF